MLCLLFHIVQTMYFFLHLRGPSNNFIILATLKILMMMMMMMIVMDSCHQYGCYDIRVLG